MSGYNNFSKSNNAVDAELNGLVNLTKASRLLNTNSTILKQVLEPEEWHHTSKHYNRTNYYNLTTILKVKENELDGLYDFEIEEAKEILKKIANFKKEKIQEIQYNATILITEFEKRGSRWIPNFLKFKNVEVTEKGSYIFFQFENKNFKKNKNGKHILITKIINTTNERITIICKQFKKRKNK